jgi:PAS domain S-box-containing protein
MPIDADAIGAAAGASVRSSRRAIGRVGAIPWRARPSRALAALAAITGASGVAGMIAGSSAASSLNTLISLLLLSLAAALAAHAEGRSGALARAFNDAGEAQLIATANDIPVTANPASARLFGTGVGALKRIEDAAASPAAAAALRRLRAQADQGVAGSAVVPLGQLGVTRDVANFEISVDPVAGRRGYRLWRLRRVETPVPPPGPPAFLGAEGADRLVHAIVGPLPASGSRDRGDGARADGARGDQLRRFFDEAPVGIGLVDREGCFTQANRALGELFDTAPETLVGRGLIGFLNPADQAAVAAKLTKAAGGRPDRTPIEIRLAAPSERTLVLLLSLLETSAAGERAAGGWPPPSVDPGAAADDRPSAVASPPIDGLTLYFIDVTDQKHLEAQVAQSQKMQAIGQLAGGVAHDFNNLLTAMLGFCDLLLLRTRPGDPAFGDVMQVKQNANRAANLVRQLLAFSRQQSLQPRVLDITDVLADLAHLLRRLIGENIALEFCHGRDLGLVKVDQGQLEQVVINLAVNARDAMPEGGRLTIRTERARQPASVRRGAEILPAGDYVLIEVADTGVGIPADTLARIFEPFFSTKAVGSGTGLGLSTVYGIVKQTGGFVFVDSTPGHGTMFSIYLPRHRPEAAAPAAAEPEPALVRDLTGSGTILLVEDDDAVRMFAARALRNKGYHAIEAKSGETALAAIRNAAERIDLVITDVVMPQMDGPALVREVREIDGRIKVIFISGYAENGFRQRLGEERDIHFLPKPFNLKQLALKVKEVMQDHPRAG